MMQRGSNFMDTPVRSNSIRGNYSPWLQVPGTAIGMLKDVARWGAVSQACMRKPNCYHACRSCGLSYCACNLWGEWQENGEIW